MTDPRPLTLAEPLDIEDARVAYRRSAELRRQAVQALEAAHAELNRLERDYRKHKATRYIANTGAPSAGMRDALVDGESADARFERDVAKSAIKAAEERIAEIDAERQSLHKLVDYSIAIFRSHEAAQPSWTDRRAA